MMDINMIDITLKDKDERKKELLDKLISLGGSHDIDQLEFLKDDMEDFFRRYDCYDRQISDAKTLITIELRCNNDYKQDIIIEMAAAVCDRFLYGEMDDFYDVQLAVPFIIHTRCFEDGKILADLIFDKLKKYTDESRYERIKWAVSINMLTRMLLQLYSEDAIYLNQHAIFDPELVFRQHFDVAMHYSEKFDNRSRKAMCLIRKGCFFKDKELILENILWLRQNDILVYKLMLSELETYGLDPNNLAWKEEQRCFGIPI